jgi:hypothetical protein
VNLPKAATAKLGERAGEKNRADGAKAPKRPEPLNLEKFKDDPVKGTAPILRLRSREKVKPVLASPDFDAGIRKLASAAAAEPKAAVALSKFALHPEFSGAAAAAMKTAGAWPEPGKFKSADDRKLAADALARSQPSWSLLWLAKALVGTQARFAALRHFFASRLILASGDLMGAAEALGRDLLLDEKIIGLVTASDADAGAKLRDDAAKLAAAVRPSAPEPRGETASRTDQTTLLEEAAWSDADEALGRALRDMGALDRSFDRLESVVDGEAAERTRRARKASKFVLQWVEQAAHKRSIKALNAVGERVQFDRAFHDLGDDAAPGDYVRVVKPSIVRGDGAQQVVLLRGEVELE